MFHRLLRPGNTLTSKIRSVVVQDFGVGAISQVVQSTQDDLIFSVFWFLSPN